MRDTIISTGEREYHLELDPPIAGYLQLVQEVQERYGASAYRKSQHTQNLLSELVPKSYMPDWQCQHTHLAEAAFFGSGIPSICPAIIKNSIYGSLARSEHGNGSPVALGYCHLLAAFSYAALRDRNRDYPLPDSVRIEYDQLIDEHIRYLVILDRPTHSVDYPITDQTGAAANASAPGYA